MANLVFLSSDKTTPLTSTYIIAKALNRDTNDLNKLIVRFKSDFEEFGTIQILDLRSQKTGNGGQRFLKDYYLNEQQATLLGTYLRNSDKVRQFKKALVKAFFEMRQQLQLQNQPKTDSLPNYYSDEKIKELKDKSRKQGFAMACSMFKKDENGLTERDRKQLEKAKAFIDWYSEKRVAIHDTWKLQRELTHELRELTYKLEQSGDLLSLLFGGYVGTLSEVSYYLNNKLQETNK